MLRRFYLGGLGLAFGLFMSVMPAGVSATFAASPQMGASPQQNQQQTAPQEPTPQQQTQQEQQMEQMQQQQEQQSPQSKPKKQSLLTGKITLQGGHYVFQDSSSNATLRISNPSKVKKYNGDNVKLKGTVNQTAQTIHVSKIKALAS